MTIKFRIHEKTFKKIEKQRSCWFKIGVIFAPTITIVILEWDNILALKNDIWMIIGLTIAGIGFVWWFWTMWIIKKLVQMKLIEIQVLQDTVKDIKTVNEDVKKLK